MAIVDLSRPKKIPVGDDSGLKRFEGKKLDDGSFVLTFFVGDEFGKPKEYTATNGAEAISRLSEHLLDTADTEPQAPRPPRPVGPKPVGPKPVARAAVAKAAPAPEALLGGEPEF